MMMMMYSWPLMVQQSKNVSTLKTHGHHKKIKNATKNVDGGSQEDKKVASIGKR